MTAASAIPPNQTANQAQYGFGQTHHARSWPAINHFAVGTVFVRLPMRALMSKPPGKIAGFGVNRAALIGFSDRDHGERRAEHGSALTWVDGILHDFGVTEAQGECWLYTFPRVLGYAFKPVSFWFCHSAAGGLRAIVAEVHNTFGEQHTYLLRHADGRDLIDGEVIVADKVFHVSPFFPVRGEYRFRWQVQAAQSVVHIDYYDSAHKPDSPDKITLSTRISGQHMPITRASTRRALWSYPAQAVSVVARIHWQALKLWLKKVPFYRLPDKPAVAVTTNRVADKT